MGEQLMIFLSFVAHSHSCWGVNVGFVLFLGLLSGAKAAVNAVCLQKVHCIHSLFKMGNGSTCGCQQQFIACTHTWIYKMPKLVLLQLIFWVAP